MLKYRTTRGVMLIEALVALIVVSLGILGVSKLQSHLITSSGETKARAEAMAIAEGELEQLRNLVRSDQYGEICNKANKTFKRTNAEFTSSATCSDEDEDDAYKSVVVRVSWMDREGKEQTVALASNVLWEDPLLTARLDDPDGQENGIRPPTGDAVRGEGSYDDLPEGDYDDISDAYIYEHDGGTELLDSDGNILLSLPTLDGDVRSFVTIRGRVYFDDQSSGSTIAASGSSSDDLIDVRLSSEGLCFTSDIPAADDVDLRSFEYICYVGPGWYGNVGIVADVSGNAPKVCVGTPSAANDGTTTSYHATVGYTRTYRGFREGADGVYWSTGVESGSHYPPAGSPQDDAGGLENNFLLTRSNQSCEERMARSEFSGSTEESVFERNYGRYVCINPHASSDPVLCDDDELDIWPGFPGSGTGGQCETTISGGMYDRRGSVTVDFGDGLEATCDTGGQLGNRNFSCERVPAVDGSELTIRNQYIRDDIEEYCWETVVKANCSSLEIDFGNAEEDEDIVQCGAEED